MRGAARVITLLATLGLAATAGAQLGAGAPARGVEPRFEVDAPGRSPFPSDLLTVPDATQRTGRRVALPLPDCAAARSACDDVRLLGELDGFDLSPRLALPFSGPIDLDSVSPRSVLLVRLAPGPPEASGVDRLVWDPTTVTLYARPETFLEPETRYGLVVTTQVRDASGRPLRASPTFHRFLRGRGGPPRVRAYREALAGLAGVLGRRGVPGQGVAVAAVFTTGSLTAFLESARGALDHAPRPPARMTAPEEGGLAYFPRESLRTLTLRQQDGVAPPTFGDVGLPLAALRAEAVAGIGVGWYWSPSYLARDRLIPEGPTGRMTLAAAVETPVPLVVVLPAGRSPPGGWPVAIAGHGYGGEMLSTACLVAGTLARHGIATVAVTVVGHGGGPESRLVAGLADGTTRVVRVPGRGVDLDGDGKIGRAEGLGPLASGPLGLTGIRDGLRQQAVDLLALVRALRGGLDVDGDGRADLGGPVHYVGQSLGGIYGTLFLALEHGVSTGVLNVPGGPIAEIARLSPVFRPLLRDVLARRAPPLVDAEEGGFREDLPLRGERPVTGPTPGALAVQEYLARAEWLGRRGDPVAWARHLRLAPLGGRPPARVLVQFATGDRVVPNPTTSALLRAGDLADAATLVRYERIAPLVEERFRDPHGFLLRTGAPGLVGRLARAAQEQAARFMVADGAVAWMPDGAFALPEGVFEVPAAGLPEGLGFAHTSAGAR